MTPWFETVCVEHPDIPGSRHEVPKSSLVFIQRSGWVIADTVSETAETSEAPQPKQSEQTAETTKAQTDTTSSSRRSSKKDG